ncbi:MAG: hypothetical protein V4658_06305 [Bacteroidota bacterium]
MLKTLFHDLIIQYKPTEEEQTGLWNEIETAYSAPERSYHTLTHIQSLINHLIPVKQHILDWNALLFAAFYHDIVYTATSKNNEEESAIMASDRMSAIMVPADLIAHCTRIILATKSHAVHPDNDINIFLDADLAILGSDEATYRMYSNAIRSEYKVFADPEYKAGRKKVLDHFLARPHIFITGYFNTDFEEQARQNLQQEIQRLEARQ